MKLSVVVPTKNEALNIGNCLAAFAKFGATVELIVVDNSSSDNTCELALSGNAKVFRQGPERCAQRNRGWREAVGEYVMFVDADMIVPDGTIREILATIADGSVDCLYIPEVRVGYGLRTKARNFERSFYNGTCIDGLRVIRRTLLENTDGYDEDLVACEDWDLDRRLLALGARTSIVKGSLLHNEAKQSLIRLLEKKAYYAASIAKYREKWSDDEICRRQFGIGYRYFGIFFGCGNWKKTIRHPILFSIMMLERVAIGVVYLLNR